MRPLFLCRDRAGVNLLTRELGVHSRSRIGAIPQAVTFAPTAAIWAGPEPVQANGIYSQADRTNAQFLEAARSVLRHWSSAFIETITQLREQYPALDIQVRAQHTVTPYAVVRHVGWTGINPFDPNLHTYLGTLHTAHALKTALETLYPNLFFAYGIVPGIAGTELWSIWCARWQGGEKLDGTATGLHLRYPFTAAQHRMLSRVNEQAGKAQVDGWFFCTVCRKARPRATFGGFHFASMWCEACATPDWRQQAAAETYR